MIRSLTLIAALCASVMGASILGTTAGFAGERPVLRGDITVESNIATIGDFFVNAGHMALTPLFRAPDLGQSGTVSASFVMDRAASAGLANPDRDNLTEVIVRRASTKITPDMITSMLREALAERIGAVSTDSIDVNFAHALPREEASATATVPLYLEQLDYSARSGRFDARLTVRQGHRDKTIAIAGTAVETVDVAILARRLLRGDTVQRSDLSTQRIPRNRLRAANVIDAADIVGLVARRSQRPGQPLISRDFQPPLMVKRREKVIITYRVPGMLLTVQGQALEDGSEGDTIEVLNAQSLRRIEATVSGPGRVTVISGTSHVAGLREALQ
ncbi:flagellar basal body P-ring formation chaperone FlgA [Breoghania sp. L-A4]|uniref:flagellar basal body P-ring formation chaperone FlgA n=1 Tax=Breoghania sp. L-A4 TaxID=2304600 RepID=UPI000E35D159|nr:flagellar basal body P-ring formation chaperone FlgA [Breoghania sp. L-A4]AXS41212.1 flagella basal body P-ring formation protein FlgA [Breoghania sp. L-A4]